MKTQIQSIHFTVKKELKNFINKHIDKLTVLDDKIISVEVFLKLTKVESYNNKIVEIKLHSSFAEYFAKKQSNSFEESVDLVSQALRKQILKGKSK